MRKIQKTNSTTSEVALPKLFVIGIKFEKQIEKIFNLPRTKMSEKKEDEIVRGRIELAIQEKATSLDLSGLGLKKLPISVRQLKNLEYLNLSGNSIRTLPDWLCKFEMLQELRISRNGLVELPEMLGNLAYLQILEVGMNNLNSLPKSITNLKNLVEIDVGNNSFKEVPNEVLYLPGLQELSIWRNRLTVIPEQIGNLLNLETLNVGGNNLRSLPPTLSGLKKMRCLYAWGNKFEEIPPVVFSLGRLRELRFLRNSLTAFSKEIFKLKWLQVLDLGENGIETIPDEFRDLPRLRQLYLSQNRLKRVPTSIFSLQKLELLSLHDNQIDWIPERFGALSRLKDLYLQANQISKIPESIGRLKNLDRLKINNNKIEKIPDAIQGCVSLRHLDVAYNKISTLPRSISKLPLEELLVQGNPELGLSQAITGKYPDPGDYRTYEFRSPRAILEAFFAAKALESRPLNEIKLVMVGRGAAGKTSLVRRLVKNTFSRKVTETQGIDISKWSLHCGGIDPVRVNIWDFAGQVVTHSTHQFFLSESSVYILVLTGREDTQKVDAEYWLRLIRAFSTNEDGEVSPVIVAMNKFAANPFKLDKFGLQDKYPFIVGFVETDCESGLGIENLRNKLSEIICKMRIVHQTFKLSWWKIKKELERSQKKYNYLPYSSFQQICNKHHEKEIDQQRFLADVFHALGVALNYGNDERLKDATVLNPRWVTDGIYKLLREAVSSDGSALLRMDAVSAVLGNEPENMRRYLVELMRRFDLAFPINGEADYWLVPQRLPAEQPDLSGYWSEPKEATRLRFTYTVIPEGLLPRFICRTHLLSELDAGNEALPRWSSGVILADNGARALIRMDEEERQINVTVTGDKDERLALLGVIQSDFHTIHSDIKGLDPKEELEIEGQPGVFLSVQTLRADEQKQRSSAASTPKGTIEIDSTKELNRLSMPAARNIHAKRPQVFISYTSADSRMLDNLLLRLKPLKETHGLLDTWSDRCISPGQVWDNEVREELERADLVLLLVSANFLASDYIRGVEIARAMERFSEKACQVIPIILESTDWETESFGICNALPRKGKPIRSTKPQRDGWYQVGIELRQVLEKMVSVADSGSRGGNN